MWTGLFIEFHNDIENARLLAFEVGDDEIEWEVKEILDIHGLYYQPSRQADNDISSH